MQIRRASKPLTFSRGVTLLELMIAVAIMAIIVAVAYPSYSEHIISNRRVDAQGALMGFVTAMERYRADNNSYTGAVVGTVYPSQAPIDSNDKFYNLSIPVLTASNYTLRATPIAGTVQDGDGYLEITSTGLKRWDENNNGSIGTGESDWND